MLVVVCRQHCLSHRASVVMADTCTVTNICKVSIAISGHGVHIDRGQPFPLLIRLSVLTHASITDHIIISRSNWGSIWATDSVHVNTNPVGY